MIKKYEISFLCQLNGLSDSCEGCPLVSGYDTRNKTVKINELCMNASGKSTKEKEREVKVTRYLCSEFIEGLKCCIDKKFKLKVRGVK